MYFLIFAELIQKLVAEVEDRQNNDLTEQRDIKTVLPVLLQRGETLGYLLLHNISHVIKMDTIFKTFCSLIMFFFLLSF